MRNNKLSKAIYSVAALSGVFFAASNDLLFQGGETKDVRWPQAPYCVSEPSGLDPDSIDGCLPIVEYRPRPKTKREDSRTRASRLQSIVLDLRNFTLEDPESVDESSEPEIPLSDQALLLDVVNLFIARGDDSSLRKLAILCQVTLQEVGRYVIVALARYCLHSKSTSLQCEGINLIVSFPAYELRKWFSTMSFENRMVQRKWERALSV